MVVPSLQLQSVIGSAAIAVAGLSFAWAAASDLRLYEIPDAASIAIALGWLAWSAASPGSAPVGAVIVGVALLLLGTVLFARGSMGGGDVKLLAVAGLWTGPRLLAEFAVVMGLAGAALSVLLLSPLRRWLPPAPVDATAARPPGGWKQPMPFGVAIAAGGAWVLLRHAAPNL